MPQRAGRVPESLPLGMRWDTIFPFISNNLSSFAMSKYCCFKQFGYRSWFRWQWNHLLLCMSFHPCLWDALSMEMLPFFLIHKLQILIVTCSIVWAFELYYVNINLSMSKKIQVFHTGEWRCLRNRINCLSIWTLLCEHQFVYGQKNTSIPHWRVAMLEKPKIFKLVTINSLVVWGSNALTKSELKSMVSFFNR